MLNRLKKNVRLNKLRKNTKVSFLEVPGLQSGVNPLTQAKLSEGTSFKSRQVLRGFLSELDLAKNTAKFKPNRSKQRL